MDEQRWLRQRLMAGAQHLHQYRNTGRALVDLAVWCASITIGIVVRADPSAGDAVGPVLALGFVAHVLVTTTFGLYRGRYRTSSFDEVRVLALAWLLTAGALAALHAAVLDAPLLSPSVMLGSLLALGGMLAARLAWRSLVEGLRRPAPIGRRRVVVFGAGDCGQAVVRAMLSHPGSPYVPVALLDDDPGKAHRRISGLPVVGSRTATRAALEAYEADVLLVAVAAAGQQLIGELFDAGIDAGAQVLILPGTRELLGRTLSVSDVRPLSEADLLGREEVEVDEAGIAACLRGKRVLITGAGGSIGSELSRQVQRLAPAGLYLLDRDESGLHAVQLSMEGRALLDSDSLIVADIRDAERMHEVFQEVRPHVVFHAAALKHLTLLERHPGEGRKTNVEGTANVLSAARRAGVERFVNISTDKAADPSSVLGRTKLAAERLTAEAARATGQTYVSVRFGNVLGSRGSVLPTFRAQIEAGGPVTVTDPDATRYFMTIPEAVRLVLQAAAIGSPGEVLILDMGQPVKIADLARRLIAHSGRDLPIVFTGLRPGEKRHEQLISATERTRAPHHPRILHTIPAVEPVAFSRPDRKAPLPPGDRRPAPLVVPVERSGTTLAAGS